MRIIISLSQANYMLQQSRIDLVQGSMLIDNRGLSYYYSKALYVPNGLSSIVYS